MVLSVRTYLIAGLVFAATATLAELLLWPHSTIYDSKVAEVRERHLLIAENLGAAMETYYRDLVAVMDGFAAEVAAGGGESARAIFENLHFRHICVADPQTGVVIRAYMADTHACPEVVPPDRLAMFRTLANERAGISPVVAPPSEEPRLFLARRAGDRLVIGAVHTTFFGDLQERISFGRRGHAAIVDRTGHVLAHPRADWTATAKDLSLVDPVARMMNGEKGVSTFYSPALEDDMIAGFTAVPGAGWGVMVPQPLSELQEAASTFTRDAILILSAGLLLSLGIALFVSGQLSRGITGIAANVRKVATGQTDLDAPQRTRPVLAELDALQRDVSRMATAIGKAQTDLTEKNGELSRANALLHTEIDERTRAEARRAESDWRLESLVRNMPFAIREEDLSAVKREIDALDIPETAAFERHLDANPDFVERCRELTVVLEVNPAALALHGFGDEADMKSTVARKLSAESVKLLRGTLVAMHRGARRQVYEVTIYPQGREARRVETTWFAMPGHEADYSRVLLTSFDITERARSEERLRKAQKMEAVGQLTGGMAHDFNNLLTVIGGNADLIEMETPETPFVAPIRESVKRGSELTQRLLAFSRRQPLAPTDLDVNALVTDMIALLRRTLGEAIRVETSIPDNLWFVLADRNQLENAILNLGLNARDAMPNGGTLRIACENVTVAAADASEVGAGDYVRLSVTDTGEGMTTEVLSRAFEPFFTTKDVGRGSGLGLSMIYGFAKQSGGLAQISSHPDLGTTVEICLPRGTSYSILGDELTAPTRLLMGRGEAVLLLEDQDDVRRGMSRLLEALRYEVHAAPDALQARAILSERAEIEIALCDIQLPGGVSGIEFADEAMRADPYLAVVFMSGNPPGTLGAPGSRTAGCDLLLKPVGIEALARALHRAARHDAAMSRT